MMGRPRSPASKKLQMKRQKNRRRHQRWQEKRAQGLNIEDMPSSASDTSIDAQTPHYAMEDAVGIDLDVMEMALDDEIPHDVSEEGV